MKEMAFKFHQENEKVEKWNKLKKKMGWML